MYKIAISKPILTLVFGLMLIFFGVLALFRFPVSLWPDIDFPVAMVITTYPGANAETIETKVTDKVEEALSGIDGMDKITSITAQNTSLVIAQFVLEKDKSEAMNDLRDKVGAIYFDDTNINSPIVYKYDSSSSPILNVFVSSDKVPIQQLMRVADEVVKPKLERIPGVAGSWGIGYRDRAIRIQPDVSLMNKYGITYAQLAQIIAQENVEISGGRIRTDAKEWVVTIDSNAKSVEDLREIRITNNVKLGDIAEVTDYINEDTTLAKVNGVTGVIYQVQKLAGQNDIEIADNVYKILPELREQLKDYNIEVMSDSTEYIRESIADVKFDLMLGAILATTIVFVFLRSFTMTIVAAISLPVSIIGTFAVVQGMGQSLNMLVMVALTLAIGIIIDDAIVVIENIHKKIEKGLPRLEAAYEGVQEIGFAIIAISAMLLAVFVPIATMGDMIGRILESFALSVVAAIIISYFVVVTIIPTVSSLVISGKHSKFYLATEPFFKGIEQAYVKTVQIAIRFRYVTLAVVAIFFAASLMLISQLGFNFMSSEDTGEFNVFVETKPGTTLDAMQIEMDKVYDEIIKDSAITTASVQIGYDSSRNPYKAKVYVKLKPRVERKDRDQFVIMADVRKMLREKFSQFTTSVSEISSMGGGPNAPLQVIIKGNVQSDVTKSAEQLIAMLRGVKGITDIRTDTPDYAPEYRINILRQNANRANVSAQTIGAAINAAFSGESTVAYYRENAKEYDILLRVPDDQRTMLEDLKYLQIPNANGEMVFIDGLIEIKETTLPSSIKRYDRERSITIYGNIDQDQSNLTNVLEEMNARKAEWLVDGTNYTLDGEAKYATETIEQILIAVVMAFILIYLILAALYESLVQPIIIMITLPLSFSGAFIGLWITGNSLTMFGLIGLMVLMGVVGKNATLIIDMANEFRNRGKSLDEAIVLAGESRLRPIMMTVFAMVFGMLPLAVSTGAGSSMKYPIGIAMIGGLIVSMFLSLLAVPAFYKIMAPVDDFVRSFYAKNLKFK